MIAAGDDSLSGNRLLCSLETKDVRALGYAEHPAYSMFLSLITVLDEALGREPSTLFAVPVENQSLSVIDYFTERSGIITPFASLSDAGRQQALGSIRHRALQIDPFIKELRQSAKTDEVMMAEILESALHYPNTDFIYLVGDTPVVAAWGFSSDPDNRSLDMRTLVEEPERHLLIPQETVPEAPLPIQEAEQEPVSRFRWKKLLWPLLLLLLSLLLLWLVPRCDKKEQPLVAPENNKEEAREVEERLQEKGAIIGDVTASLIWNNFNDLDLSLVCPGNEVVSFEKKTRVENGCGELDVDANPDGTQLTREPVENIYLLQKDMKPGSYEIWVKLFKEVEQVKTPFTVRLKRGEQEEFFNGVLEKEKPNLFITGFEVQ